MNTLRQEELARCSQYTGLADEDVPEHIRSRKGRYRIKNREHLSLIFMELRADDSRIRDGLRWPMIHLISKTVIFVLHELARSISDSCRKSTYFGIFLFNELYGMRQKNDLFFGVCEHYRPQSNAQAEKPTMKMAQSKLIPKECKYLSKCYE